MSTHIRSSLVGVLCVMLVSALFIGCGQSRDVSRESNNEAGRSVSWESNNEAGREAYRQGNYAEAEKQWLVALQEAEKFGPEDPRLATSLNNLVELYHDQGKYTVAELLYKRLLTISEKALGAEHPDVAQTLENYAGLLREMWREEDASIMEARAKAIREKNAQENPR